MKKQFFVICKILKKHLLIHAITSKNDSQKLKITVFYS